MVEARIIGIDLAKRVFQLYGIVALPKHIERRYQVDSRLARKYEGTGLGLPLAKSLVELGSGSLDQQSEVGVGTTATVRFPKERIVRSPRDNKAVGAADKMAG